jgi:hypothetical protein
MCVRVCVSIRRVALHIGFIESFSSDLDDTCSTKGLAGVPGENKYGPMYRLDIYLYGIQGAGCVLLDL